MNIYSYYAGTIHVDRVLTWTGKSGQNHQGVQGKRKMQQKRAQQKPAIVIWLLSNQGLCFCSDFCQLVSSYFPFFIYLSGPPVNT
ncbi:hypothetical protein, partial [Dryocola clanedunensis]|uniref:hypothetical protein n=1 Tax=Dryocola clanedunensis TaxID=2925396 RepID=UPI0022F10D21